MAYGRTEKIGNAPLSSQKFLRTPESKTKDLEYDRD